MSYGPFTIPYQRMGGSDKLGVRSASGYEIGSVLKEAA